MKKKIFYLMHVDWGWIKQRPHFIAEKLDEVFDITVFYMFARNRKSMTKNPSEINKFPIIPFPLKRIKILNILNTITQKTYLSLMLKILNPEVIWITHPSLYDYVPKKAIKKCKIIYDCMDDVQGFNLSDSVKKALDVSEKQLLNDSEAVFVSSQNLQKKVVERGCEVRKTILVRNGYNGEIIQTEHVQNNATGKFKAVYIGTISDWIDFDTLQKSLEDISELEYHFYGPIDCAVPNNERIIFHGPVKHSLLYETIKDCSILIMPFEVNELIQSVDPVKLYEYINFNKNIVTVYYKEIERFNDYVHFYHNTEEYIEVLKKLITNNKLKYSEEQRIEFLNENSWDRRTEIVINKLKEL